MPTSDVWYEGQTGLFYSTHSRGRACREYATYVHEVREHLQNNAVEPRITLLRTPPLLTPTWCDRMCLPYKLRSPRRPARTV